MPLRLSRGIQLNLVSYPTTWAPFLYPFLSSGLTNAYPSRPPLCRWRLLSTSTEELEPGAIVKPLTESLGEEQEELVSVRQAHHPHSAYTTAPFTDLKVLTLISGNGGNGCVSFLREKFVPNGPANGGNGGSGGSIYVQAVYGETSLHKISRGAAIRASSGRHGQGSAINGKRGEDVIIRVPVGTVVRELSRWDPVLEDIEDLKQEENANEDNLHGGDDKWVHYPRSIAENTASESFRATRYPTRHHLSASETLSYFHPDKILLDLSKPTLQPILLIPGAPGGLGNPNFVTGDRRRPKYATRGGKGMQMKIQLELKVLADVGLVGLPNAGKSSFLRAVSGRKARVGEWAFTTLAPNIGTIVMDERYLAPLRPEGEGPRLPRFTIADIPGLIADAHLNKGLGHGFLRHIERARVLGFVIDLSREDPVADLQGLWREVKAYEQGWTGGEGQENVRGMMSEMSGDKNADIGPVGKLADGYDGGIGGDGWPDSDFATEHIRFDGGEEVHFTPSGSLSYQAVGGLGARKNRPRMTSKPWFVIANKSDLPNTEPKYWAMKRYLEEEAKKRSDGKEIGLIPISALREQGVEMAVEWMKGMLGFK